MKKFTITSILVAAALSLSAAPSLAGNIHDPGVNKRQHHQAKRIKHGIKSGQLTGRETFGLAREQAHIHRMERHFKADGHLGVGERVRLHRELNQASRHIYKQKHDGQYRH